MNTEELKKLTRPSFDNPPLAEVVVSFQLEHPLNIGALDVAELWDDFDKTHFPTYREMPPLEPILPDNVRVLELSHLPNMPRFWFEGVNKDELLQIQRDRFLYNWRRPTENIDNTNCYPRYESVMKGFMKYNEIYCDFVKKKNLGDANRTFMELSYINLVEIPEGGIQDIGTIFKGIELRDNETILPTPNNIQYTRSFNIPDRPLKLNINLSSRQRISDGKSVFQYELLVRGPVNNLSSKDMVKWFDDARMWINHSFVDSTTEFMHKTWGVK
jgi:uncharacterized protein (TIGR04255 family)